MRSVFAAAMTRSNLSAPKILLSIVLALAILGSTVLACSVIGRGPCQYHAYCGNDNGTPSALWCNLTCDVYGNCGSICSPTPVANQTGNGYSHSFYNTPTGIGLCPMYGFKCASSGDCAQATDGSRTCGFDIHSGVAGYTCYNP